MPKDRIPHKENKGITIVAKPSTKVVVYLLAVCLLLIVILGVNVLQAGM